MKSFISILITAVLISASFSSFAEPVPEAERIPVDIRRTTFIVNDIDKSLLLYRDALGLKVIYDQDIISPMDNGKQRVRRLVLLQANDDFIGAIGLLQYVYPLKPQRQEHFDEPVPGDPIVVINAKDLDTRWSKVANTDGISVISAPEVVTYPRANGENISVNMSMIRDADGYWLEINQILDAPACADDGS